MKFKIVLLSAFFVGQIHPMINNSQDGLVIKNVFHDGGYTSSVTQGAFTKITKCHHGNCHEVHYYAGKQLSLQGSISLQSASNNPQIAPKSPFFSFLAAYPVLSSVLVGGAVLATGYGLYKVSQWLKKPKK